MLFRGTLWLLIGGALFGSVSATALWWRPASLTASATLLALSIVLGAALKINGPERIWFGARAVAESIKSLTWRYVVGGEPYGWDLPPQAADEKFAAEMQGVLNERRALAWNYSAEPGNAPQITSEMRTIRATSTGDRLALYVRERIQQQREWYGSKASDSRHLHTKWFWITVVGQSAALTASIMMVRFPESNINPTGTFSTLSAAALAWLQMKRYQDLSQAYSLAAHELGLIEAQAQHVNTESELSQFVANAENAISREHTMWVARRDVG